MALKPCPHCGHPISEQAEKCPACGQDPRLSPEELAAQTEAKKAKRKRTGLIAGICAAVVLVVGGICAALFLPDYLDYRAACDLLEQRDFVAAAKAFDEMGDYRDSAQQALEARYQYVMFNKTRDDKQTRVYLYELAEAAYKDAARIEDQIYRWDISVVSCTTKTGAPESNIFSQNEPLFFYVSVKGGRIGETRRLRYEVTTYPSLYWQMQGVPESTQQKDMGTFQDGGYYWFGWENGVGTNVIGSVTFSLYDADTNKLLETRSVSVY